MKKILKHIIIITLIMTGFLASADIASANTARTSAKLSPVAVVQPEKEEDRRAEILEAYLKKYNSPLADHAQTFIDEADKNDIDWRWVVSIAGVESGYGHQIPPYSYNAWGYGVYGNNVRRFASWDDGIATVSKALRDDYINRWGARDIYGVGSKYAADKNWANKVTRYMNEIDAFEKKYVNRNQALPISL